jgi:DNA-binding transcriptional LysR family regulator
MSRFKQIESFVSAAGRGSLSAAAQAEGVAPSLIGRRITALEARLGVKLLVRTTRRVSPTFEGNAFLSDCQRLLDNLHNAEASASLRGVNVRGHLRVTAPAGFGRVHVAPLVPGFLAAHRDVTISLDLTDRLTDIVNENIDVGVRISALGDASLVGLQLVENRRVVVASPSYLQRRGVPAHPYDLAAHNCLTFGTYGNQARGWTFTVDGRVVSVRVSGTLECNDGAVLRDWALTGRGLAWRSMWEVANDLRAGRLRSVLDEFAAPPNAIYAIFPQRRHLPLHVRMFIDHLKNTYGNPSYWRRG